MTELHLILQEHLIRDVCLRPSIDGVEEIVLLRVHSQSLHTVHGPIDHSHIGTR